MSTPSSPPKAPPAPAAWRNIPTIRGVAILAMVVCHAYAHRDAARALLRRAPEATPWWDAVFEHISRGLVVQCVPIFLFVSGFLMARLSKTWKAAWASSRNIAIRYCLWSIPAYALMFAFGREFDLKWLLWSFFNHGPYYGTYWFLVLLFELSLLVPLLYAWITKSPKTSLAACLLLQVLDTGAQYWRFAHGDPQPSHFVLFRLPFFLGGMWMSVHWESIVRYVLPRRSWFLAAALVGQVAILAESYYWGVRLGVHNRIPGIFVDETASIVLTSLPVLMWTLTLPNQKRPIRNRLDWLGNNSLAILLMSDLCIRVGIMVVWQAGWLWGEPPTTPGIPPAHFDSVITVLLLFVAGSAGPMITAELTEKVLGARVRRFVFG